MPDQLAQSLLRLEPRMGSATHSDAWALSWMLAVGATYSLARAKDLLPGQYADFRRDAIALLGLIAQGEDLAARASATWTLGFYLNASEARIQAALHRILRAHTGKKGKALDLVEVIEKRPAAQRPPALTMSLLSSFRSDVLTQAGALPLAKVWIRGNSVKHDPKQDVSDQFNFGGRWTECRSAISDLISLIDVLGPK